MHLLRKNVAKYEAVDPQIAADVRAGLSATPKTLPPRLFYDEAGSELFEQITTLPKYYLTRTEQSIFLAHAAEMLHRAGDGLTLIELGAGTAAKTSVIIKALFETQMSVTFYPIDVSASALEIADRNLASQFPALKIVPMVGDYSLGLSRLSKVPGRKMVMYIGSSIGNFEPDEAGALLKTIRKSLNPGDTLLLGTDLVKDEETLLNAYDDAQGVTAAFNLNILTRIDRELGADFDIRDFRHVAAWNPREQRIEMHLESLRQQDVYVAGIDRSFHFRIGEMIHTENSYKFTPERVESVLGDGGFVLEKTWMDEKRWFGVHLARVE